MIPIERIHAREVFDSRGRPTVEVEVTCAESGTARVMVPSGMSTGRYEARELRDGDPKRLDGLGVTKAVAHVRGEIAQALCGLNADDQQTIDRTLRDLDGTPDKSRLGANAILGVSLATASAAAVAKQLELWEQLSQIWRRVPRTKTNVGSPKRTSQLGQHTLLPLPMVNMISGGLHAGGQLDIQDFLIVPVGAASFHESLDWAIIIYRRLGELLKRRGYEGRLVADEGGYGPKLADNTEAIELVIDAIGAAELKPGNDVALALDVAASHFYADHAYHWRSSGKAGMTSAELVDQLETWADRYPIISIEDGLAEDDREGWLQLTARLGDRLQLIGDDLFATHRSRLERGIQSGTANSVLIKVNQVGTLWETLETARLTLDADYWPVVSARSGDTEDSFIADLAVAIGAGQIKIGSVTRSERLSKYNQLLRLEDGFGRDAGYAGGAIFKSLNMS
jgi:enolase